MDLNAPIYRPRIVCAAVQFGDGTIVCGARHYDMVMQAIIEKLPIRVQPETQGFIDSRGQFYCRITAKRQAIAAGQVLIDRGYNLPELYSEDLY